MAVVERNGAVFLELHYPGWKSKGKKELYAGKMFVDAFSATGAGPPRASEDSAPEDAETRKTEDAETRIVVRQDNPKREGTSSRARYETYKAATTFEEYHALGGTTQDLAWDLEHGFVSRSAPS